MQCLRTRVNSCTPVVVTTSCLYHGAGMGMTYPGLENPTSREYFDVRYMLNKCIDRATILCTTDSYRLADIDKPAAALKRYPSQKVFHGEGRVLNRPVVEFLPLLRYCKEVYSRRYASAYSQTTTITHWCVNHAPTQGIHHLVLPLKQPWECASIWQSRAIATAHYPHREPV